MNFSFYLQFFFRCAEGILCSRKINGEQTLMKLTFYIDFCWFSVQFSMNSNLNYISHVSHVCSALQISTDRSLTGAVLRS